MQFSIRKLVLAIVVAVIVTIVLALVGGILGDLKVKIAQTVGSWLKSYGSVIGILAGLWYYFDGSGPKPVA